ncbi:MAG: D-aminoacyl-tRNA deacylase [Slackia faecicanis]|nr:D-aminoacyl-tRNA deacylase [Slackia faecicanis]
MRALVQRVTRAQVDIDGETVSSIGKGFVVLLGVGHDDAEEQADKLWSKISKMRIFEDENGKTNIGLADIGGEVLVVSQFTLYADCKRGNRPSFTNAGAPDEANRLYEYFVELARKDVEHVGTGSFGADMKVELVNDGPFTVWLDTDTL